MSFIYFSHCSQRWLGIILASSPSHTSQLSMADLVLVPLILPDLFLWNKKKLTWIKLVWSCSCDFHWFVLTYSKSKNCSIFMKLLKGNLLVMVITFHLFWYCPVATKPQPNDWISCICNVSLPASIKDSWIAGISPHNETKQEFRPQWHSNASAKQYSIHLYPSLYPH